MIRFVCPRCWAVREIADDSLLGSVVKCNDCHGMAVATHTADPLKPGRRRKTTHVAAGPCPAAQPVGGAVHVPSAANVVLSTGDIPTGYDILDLVFAQASWLDGPEEEMAFADVFQLAKRRLANEAAQLGAGGVIHVHFDFRTTGKKPRIFEVFACGTAVRLRSSS